MNFGISGPSSVATEKASRYRGWIVRLILGLAISGVHQVAVPAESTDWTPQISILLEQEQLAGMVWSTLADGVVETGSAGFANVANQSAMIDSQKVHVGSVTKTVLAVGVMRLITEGKLRLDSEVAALLPELAIDNPWHETAPVTVGTLLAHTAGLDNTRMWQFLSATPTPDTPLLDAFPPSDKKLLAVRSMPGTQYSYSNMGYTILGMVIEAVVGERYEKYLDKNLLKPLGMTDSSFEFISQEGAFASKTLAMGYFENNVAQASLPMYLRPAGQFTTTAPDIGKLMTLMLNDGQLQGTPFIKPELMRWLAYPNNTHASNIGLQVGHGLALAVRDRHGVIGLCHPGTTIGFRAYLCLFPEDEKGFFYAINTDNETANYEQFVALFIAALSIAESPLEHPESQFMDIEALTGFYLPSPNNMAEFEWLDLVFNFIWLGVDNGKLLMRSLQQDTRELLPLNQALLRATDRSRASHGIIVDETGDILLTNGLGTFRKTSPFKIAAYWISLVSGLLGLLYILCFGLLRIINRNANKRKVLALPVACLLGFSIPVYLYLHQPFFEFGDKNAASVSLALMTGLLPLTLLVAILYWFKSRKNVSLVSDVVALFISLQLCLVLFYWDLMPLVFWR